MESASKRFNKERIAWRDVIDWQGSALATLHKELVAAFQRADHPPPTISDVETALKRMDDGQVQTPVEPKLNTQPKRK